ncbi:NUDIX domain-containing protein [Weissella ceti]|uniref:NUDIX domain-containing protein n=1 Tax=Weissella ceti TaxID=759620 RepID=A0ABT3E2S1_9LACO|nr:NUDIX domain-containing protein [Weissella ceti]MCW0952716.1 NUDIX domain-containing protein [Weissella ceti]QVK12418.1 NUDIX domain-containing protein [Weissella ceti]
MTHFKNFSAVYALIFDDAKEHILVHERVNTGKRDGYLDVAASGHVDENESMSEALIREIREEIGLEVNVEDLSFAVMIHQKYGTSELTYYNGYFVVNKYEGTPQVQEPHKSAGLQWVPINDLPDNFIPDRKLALDAYFKGIPYLENGWK